MSLPLSVFLDVPVTTLTCLKRYLRGQSLPDGWTEYSDSTTCTGGSLIFTKLTIKLPLLSASASFLVKVDEELKWTLSCHGALVDIEQCGVLDGVPCQLNTARAVLDLLATLQESQICCGNPVRDFKALVDARGGIFKDSSGIVDIVLL